MRKFIATLSLLAILFSLTACGFAGEDSLFDMEGKNDEDVDAEFAYTEDYIDEHLKGDYSITYKMTYNEKGVESTSYQVKMMHNSEGYFIYMGEDSGMLYIKNGENYDLYIGDSTNGYEYLEGVSYTEEEVKSYAQAFLGYMSAYSQFEDGLNKKGTETIAGRSCEKYSYEFTWLGSKLNYDYYIDKETGVCMKYYVEGSYQGEGGNYQYECTEFKTSGIVLPSYAKRK